MRRLGILMVLAILTLLTLMLLAGHGPWAGETIWQYDANHGLNEGDVPVLALWGLGALTCCGLFAAEATSI